MPVIIYGIKNCDTIKKSCLWLREHGIDFSFHDYRANGLERERLKRWADQLGWEALLNKAGTTFRALPEESKHNLDTQKAMTLMLENPTLIKRPVLDYGEDRIIVGFKPENYQKIFNTNRT